MRGIRPRPRQRQVAAGAAVQRREPHARDVRVGRRRRQSRAAQRVEQPLELRPLVVILLLERERRHARRPRTHCADAEHALRDVVTRPSRVIRHVGGDRRQFVEPFRREPRRPRPRGRPAPPASDEVSGRAGGSGATFCNGGFAAGRGSWTTSVAAAISPSRLQSRRVSIVTMAQPNSIGRKSAKRSRLRVTDAATVTGRPLSITTLSPKTRLPGVAPEGNSSKTTG